MGWMGWGRGVCDGYVFVILCMCACLSLSLSVCIFHIFFFFCLYLVVMVVVGVCGLLGASRVAGVLSRMFSAISSTLIPRA